MWLRQLRSRSWNWRWRNSMGTRQTIRLLENPVVRDYGMLFVLLLLAGFFSRFDGQRTTPDRSGRGPAGRRPHSRTARQPGARADRHPRHARGPGVCPRCRRSDWKPHGCDHPGQRQRLRAGRPEAIESILARSGQIDAIAANDVTAKWTVYDRLSLRRLGEMRGAHVVHLARLLEDQQPARRRQSNGHATRSLPSA